MISKNPLIHRYRKQKVLFDAKSPALKLSSP